MKYKPRKILICGDTSLTKTGFGIYNKELISRLYQDDRFEVAEMANHAVVEQKKEVPWTFYPTGVRGDDKEYQQYIKNIENRCGKWRFEPIILDFRPDIVCCCLDPYMFSYQAFCPLKRFYNWSIATTLDSYPENPMHVNLYTLADDIFTYTDWARDIMTDTDYNMSNVRKTIPMGISDVYEPPKSRIEAKQKFNFDENTFIIGTVMRNQERKLIPHLLEAFQNIVLQYEARKNNGENLAKPILWIHTTYPDDGWDIPTYLNKYKMHDYIYFSYLNKNGDLLPLKFCEAKIGNWFIRTANIGVSEEKLRDIYQCMDLYVQYASAEGFGLPMYEAAKCGVKVAAIYYASMQEFVDKFDAIKIQVESWHESPVAHVKRAIPNPNELQRIWLNELSNINQIYLNNVDAIKTNYSWEKCVALWKDHFLSLELKHPQGKWNLKPEKIDTSPAFPKNLSNAEFVRWIYNNLTIDTKQKYCYNALFHMENLEKGFINRGTINTPINQYRIYQQFANLANYINQLEIVRYENKKQNLDYLT